MTRSSIAVWTMVAMCTGACYGQPAVAPLPPQPPQAPQAPQMPQPVQVPQPPLPPEFKFEFGAQDAVERAREAIERAREQMEWQLQDRQFAFAQLNSKFGAFAQAARGRDFDRAYREGTNQLDKREYEKAIQSFDTVIEAKAPRADGALYWKAYALNKLGRRPDALNVLAELQKNHSGSNWLNEAKALEAEIRQARGQAVSPETETDEELKIYAINSLMNTDPERAVPLLEKLLRGQNPPKIKERALFVLAQSRSPKAMETIASIARGGSNPDLQLKAVEYIGIHGGKEGRQVLPDLYRSTNDFAVKRAILRAYMIGKDHEKLLAAAKSEQNPELRREAIHWLGVTGAQAEVWQLYQSETSPELKQALIHSMFVGGNAERIIEVAKTEKNAELRRLAIHRLGTMKRTATADALASLYAGETDAGVKKQIIHSLFIQGSAKQLIDAARKESDPNLKKEIVQRLSTMKSPEATDYLVELLNK